MPVVLSSDWSSLSELLLALRRDEFLAGPFETELIHPETGVSLGTTQMPPFLYRGEPAWYPTTMGGLWRAQSALNSEEFQRLQEIVLSAAKNLKEKCREDLPFGEAIAFAQHYGFFTPLIDFSSSLYVSAHFAVGAQAAAAQAKDDAGGCYIRINLRRAQNHLDLLRPTWLGGRFKRPSLQHAWSLEPPAAVGDEKGERREEDYWRNLKSAFFVDQGIVEIFRWRRKPEEDRLFYNQYFDCPPDDPFTGWPVLFVNGFVAEHGAISDRLATLLLERLPLYHMVCFSRSEGDNTAGNDKIAVPSELFCAGVHPGRVWDRGYLYKLWTEAQTHVERELPAVVTSETKQ